jgi:hypothetical protein
VNAPATRKEVRQARAFLRSRAIETRQIEPGKFAQAAKDMGMTFADLFNRIEQKAQEMGSNRR